MLSDPERWSSGLRQRSWKPPGCKPPGVRISLSPPFFLPKKMAEWSRQALLHGTRCRFMHRKMRFIFCGIAAKCFIKNAWRWSSSISFRYEALFRYTSQYEALRSRSVWWKNEKWELCLQTFLANATLFSGKEKLSDNLIQPENSISPSPYRKLSKNCNPQL